MTFLEAAIEVLRDSTDALHFSAIAKQAVDRKLLSHVGRDPETAMRNCLVSAVRGNSDAVVMRAKPGHYQIRPGAQLPDRPPEPEPEPEPVPVEVAAEPEPKPTKAKSRAKKKKKTSTRKKTAKATSRAGSSKSAADAPSEADKPAPAEQDPAEAEESGGGSDPQPDLEFIAPSGSGLEGVTDVALVMANAMSRLAEENPELRQELEEMQSKGEREEPAARSAESAGPVITHAPSRSGRRRERERDRDRDRERDRDRDRDRDDEDRTGRRRRRRRRRTKRVEWSENAAPRPATTRGDELLDKVEEVLGGVGSRSLHVRQIAENLAQKNVLGGEISEIERAVTAAILMDVHKRGRASRFCVRGDARYQLQGSRVPEKAAASEKALVDAARTLEHETSAHLQGWLHSLGARALESVVRIYLQREGYTLLASLAPSRGLAKLVVSDNESNDDGDPEEDGEGEEGADKILVLVVPKKTSLEPKLWEGEAERHSCQSTMVFAMGDAPAEVPGEVRLASSDELSRWMVEHGIGIERLEVSVPVLDAAFVESVGGLDT